MKNILLVLLLCIANLAFSQTSTPVPIVPNTVFTVVEQMPEFPGGENALIKFISQKIVYPDHARDNDIQGRVVVGFVVNEDGSISDVAIKKSVDPDLDKEALRVVKLLPKFKPGKQQGVPVKVSYILPIKFTLAPSNSPTPFTPIPQPMSDKPAGISGDFVGAEYKSGTNAMLGLIAKENKLTKNMPSNAVKTFVMIQLSINEKGNITDSKITQNLTPSTDLEALRIAHLLKKFRPATLNGKAIKSTYSLPIIFWLMPSELPSR